jgi:transporter family protein
MTLESQTWVLWALLSAVFAALTAILANVGVAEVPPDLATFICTLAILLAMALLLAGSGQWHGIAGLFRRGATFLVLSKLATGASWSCYFRALQVGDAGRVAPVDKLSVVLVAVFGVAFLGERLSVLNWLGVVLIAAGAILVAQRG